MLSASKFSAGAALLVGALVSAAAAEWQWSVPMGEGRAFLWVPPTCDSARAVVVGQNNLLEEGILEHPRMRETLARLGIAEVLIAPPFDNRFQFDRGATERFTSLLQALADESGYAEIAAAPVIPIGHSACASYPWNFAAANPARTLAILSIKGDAPQTSLTGSGKPNPEWGARAIDGIPALMVMSEYEWWEERLSPAMAYRAAHPRAPIALLADTGHGHFDAGDALVEFLALFMRKAAEARLPQAPAERGEPAPSLSRLVAIDPADGWLVDRWRGDQARAPAAPAARYTGDRAEAFWCFDAEMAQATEAYYATTRGKRPLQVDFVQGGALVPIQTSHAGVELAFEPEADGITFRVGGAFIAPLPPKPPVAAKDKPPPVRTIAPVPAGPEMHPAGVVRLHRITGPVVQVAEGVFRVALNRTSRKGNPWSNDIWLVAEHPGDGRFKSAVQQGVLKLPRHEAGAAQHLVFPRIPDQRSGARQVALQATSDAGLPVAYYVREGPAELDGTTLRFTPPPRRARYPLKVTVVAWQFGHGADRPVQAAAPVEQTFFILP